MFIITGECQFFVALSPTLKLAMIYNELPYLVETIPAMLILPLPRWQTALAEAFTSVVALCRYLELDLDAINKELLLDPEFPLRVPLGFVKRMQKGDVDDPLLRQVLAVHEELVDYPGYSNDPVGDLEATATVGVIHKYHGRALLITTGACAINCRYCFRRAFPYNELQLSKSQQQQALAYLQQHSELTEVILSGGDPLLLSDSRLEELITQINAIKHIQRIRIHSRIPIVLPERMTPELVAMLSTSTQKIILVLHANHANELNNEVSHAMQPLVQHGITLLNQAVLLRGVNNTLEQLCMLSEQLLQIGILPYYLHLLDKARGTGHFEVDMAEAIKLHREMQTQLPGYLVPKLVWEQAGAAHKIWLH